MDLREFAENLYVSGTAQEMEFGKEILDSIDHMDRLDTCEELLEQMREYLPKHKKEINEPAQIEWLGDRSNLLEEIQDEIIPEYAERLKMAGIDCIDTDDIIRALLDRLPTEWDL